MLCFFWLVGCLIVLSICWLVDYLFIQLGLVGFFNIVKHCGHFPTISADFSVNNKKILMIRSVCF